MQKIRKFLNKLKETLMIIGVVFIAIFDKMFGWIEREKEVFIDKKPKD